MFGEIVVNLVTYSSVALVVWWIIEECSPSPAAKILGRWTETPLPQVRVKDVLFPLARGGVRLCSETGILRGCVAQEESPFGARPVTGKVT